MSHRAGSPSATGPTTTGMLRARPRARSDLRVSGAGPFDPQRGLRFDPDEGAARSLRARGRRARPRTTAARRSRPGDNTAVAMKSVVVDPTPTTGKATRRCAARSRRRSSTRCTCAASRAIPARAWRREKRGTYAGLVEKIPYLQDLGVTAVELLPVFQFDAQDAPRGPGQLLGLCAGLVLRAARRLQLAPRPARARRRVPRHGQGAAPRGHRGDPRRGLQPHGRGRRTTGPPSASAASTTAPTTCWRRTARATPTTPAPATR